MRSLPKRSLRLGPALVLALAAALAALPATAAGPFPDPNWTAESNQTDAWLGVSAAGAGDVNGDGYGDVIAGAVGYDHGQIDEGMAAVYYGSPAGLPATPDWTAEGDAVEAYFGQSVAAAGDVNGDGYGDVIVGAPWYSGAASAGGMAFVYYGSAAGLAPTPGWQAEGVSHRAYLGDSVAGAGDVNGDGYDDVIVGAPTYRTASEVGAVFVYYGSAAGLAAAPGWTYVGTATRGLFGAAVSTAGDVNGDGYDDVIVGAQLLDRGAVYAFYGSASGLGATAAWNIQGDQLDSYFGCAVATAGDVDGDGYDDVIVGARYYDHGEVDEGRVQLYRGSAAGLAGQAAWTAEGNEAWADLGNAVGPAGDVNGDGYDDLVVGGHGYAPDGATDQWRAYLYLGSAGGPAQAPEWTAGADGHSSYFGIAAAGAGDVNGDGQPDLVIGDPVHDNGQTDEGAVLVYQGRPAGAPAQQVYHAYLPAVWR